MNDPIAEQQAYLADREQRVAAWLKDHAGCDRMEAGHNPLTGSLDYECLGCGAKLHVGPMPDWQNQ